MLLRGTPSQRSSTGWWIVFGLAGGLGIENKPSMAVFLVALLLGLLLTPQRRLVFTARRCFALSPHRSCSRCPTCSGRSTTTSPPSSSSTTARSTTRTCHSSPLQFLGAQVMMLNPLSLPLWFAGRCLAARQAPESRWRCGSQLALSRLDLSHLSRAHVRHPRRQGLLPRPHLSRSLRRRRRRWQALLQTPQHHAGSFPSTQRSC